MNYKGCWLTLNRVCNLKCKWCYAKDTNYKKQDDMPLEKAYQIIDICKDLNIKHLSLIGGEPTLYPFLKEVITYAKEKNITCGIITNGVLLNNEDYLQGLIDCGTKSFSISLKGEDQNTYKQITEKDLFNTVMGGISNCTKKNIPFTIAMVLTEENIDTFLEGVKIAKQNGAKKFYFSFCYEFNTSNQYKDYLKKHNIKKIAKKFQEHYDELNEITESKFTLFQSYPMCVFNDSFIKTLEDRGQITSVCQLLKRNGLIFDSCGNLIPCNAMYEIKLGELGKDFNTAKELIEYSSKKDITYVYDKLCGLPSSSCLDCKKQKNCGGGCVCQWTNFSFEELQNLKG